MNLDQLLDVLKNDESFMQNVTCWREEPARQAVFAPYPSGIDEKIPAALQKRGISKLYTHQAACFDAAEKGKDYVVVTPTASGKTM